MLTELPELGQLVEVRRRLWAVMDIQQSSPVLGDRAEKQNLVTLASLDEDAIGESLVAIWELEPGARVLDVSELPKIEGYDSCDRLEAFLDAVRWGATTNADRTLLQSPFRSGIEIQDYQLDPLVRAVDMARVNLLIADDVGLGKTIASTRRPCDCRTRRGSPPSPTCGRRTRRRRDTAAASTGRPRCAASS